MLDGTPFDDAPVLRWSYVAIGGIGLAFYVYRELLARFFLSLHDYQVDAVRADRRRAWSRSRCARSAGASTSSPGQFAMVYLEAKDGWHRHPFTIASAPHEGVVRVTVKALGDYTSRLQELVEPGMPAVIGGPHGRFDHWQGHRPPGLDRRRRRRRAVPELAARARRHPLPQRVDFFYTADGEAPFADEIRAIAARHDIAARPPRSTPASRAA